MRITIIAAGKIKEKFYRDAMAEYAKRLGKYCRLEVIEVEDEKTPDKAGEALENQIKEKEALRMLKYVREDAHVVTLEIQGRKIDSVAFAGGSLGLHEKVSQRADDRISFSDMTFPHQLARILLAEQIYRGYRIIYGEPYHK